MVKLFQSVVAALLVAGSLALVGCADTTASGGSSVFGSGGTTGTTGPGPGPTPGPTGIQVQLLASSSQMPSAGTATVDLTAIVTDGTGQAVSGSVVTFSRGTDPSAFFTNITPAGGASDASGMVTAKLNLGANKSNRVINVSATTQGATGTTNVDVTGTTINVSGNTSLAFGASTTLTFTVTDSASAALQGFQMTITSATGNSIAPAGGTTNSAGQVVVVVTATAAGNDTLTASAAGAIKTQALTISGSSFAFTTPAANVDIPLNTATAVSITWLIGGVPQAGQQVTFSSSRGVIAGSPSTTDGAGATPGVTVSSSTAGPAVITAQGPGGNPAATLSVNFVATTASSISAQAVPGTVYITTGSPSQTNNLSTITVIVRDAANNLVKNASVNFGLTDPTSGQLSAGSAITDITGSASVTYTAGTTSSPQNGVVVSAAITAVGGVPIAPISANPPASLTVAGQALLVRLGTDNLVESLPPVNKKKWVAVVTDAGGNAVAGATVRFALRPGRFRTGFFVLPPPAPAQQVWFLLETSICPNEDTNFNGIIDAGEDYNGSGALEPPGVATVNPTAVTDASGIATATITYPKNYALWTEVILEGRSGVAGNDPPATATFVLPGLATDYNNLTVSPPGDISPFGDLAGPPPCI